MHPSTTNILQDKILFRGASSPTFIIVVFKNSNCLVEYMYQVHPWQPQQSVRGRFNKTPLPPTTGNPESSILALLLQRWYQGCKDHPCFLI
mmetsp:Transcript_7882/g.11715  ORF Transcript_7882/g.11715 Transcript_7882/m.11715 type:complete len:91 (-) Transcript_7882:97-369(-)